MKTGLVLLFILFPLLSPAAQSSGKKTALVIHSYHKGFSWTDRIDSAVTTYLKKRYPSIEIHTVYMDSKRILYKKTIPILRKYLGIKLENISPDVIISSDDNALNFILNNRNTLFKGIPIVFCGVNHYRPEVLRKAGNITGVVEAYDFGPTLKTIMQLHPSLKKLALIADITKSAKIHAAEFHRTISRFPKLNKKLQPLIGLNRETLIRKLKNFPKQSAVFYLSFFKTPDGKSYSPREGLSLIKQASGRPVYSAWDSLIGRGITGGWLVSGRQQGNSASKMAVKILSGKNADSIPVITHSPNQFIFDYKELSSNNISFSSLPKNHVIINQPENILWKNKNLFLAISGVFVLLISFLILLSIHLHQTKKSRKTALDALSEKNILVKEIHHRVKNNLQLISSLLDLQMQNIDFPEAKSALEISRQRIRSMALVHEKMYKSNNMSDIDFRLYLHTLGSNLVQQYTHHFSQIELELPPGPPLHLSINQAIPCGIIINELCTNAFKHAFHSDTAGKIIMDIIKKGDNCTLSVSDTGKGFPDNYLESGKSSLGMKIVTGLTSQLDGTLSVSSNEGMNTVSIIFPIA